MSAVSVLSVFPERSPRWVNATCRAGKIPRAFKVGGAWFILASDVARLASGGSPEVPTVDAATATADLRARGVL